jgi:hypothetical protein
MKIKIVYEKDDEHRRDEVMELCKKIDGEVMAFLDRQLKLRRIADTQENNDGCVTTIWAARRSETK